MEVISILPNNIKKIIKERLRRCKQCFYFNKENSTCKKNVDISDMEDTAIEKDGNCEYTYNDIIQEIPTMAVYHPEYDAYVRINSRGDTTVVVDYTTYDKNTVSIIEFEGDELFNKYPSNKIAFINYSSDKIRLFDIFVYDDNYFRFGNWSGKGLIVSKAGYLKILNHFNVIPNSLFVKEEQLEVLLSLINFIKSENPDLYNSEKLKYILNKK